jgi:nitroreductase
MTEPAPLSAPDAIAGRREARRFDPARPLDDDLLRRILGLATHAPSSFNLQPWRFVVVRSERNRRRLRGCAFNHPAITDAPAVVIVLGYLNGFETDLGPMLERSGLTPEAAAEVRGRATAAASKLDDRSAWATRSTMMAVATLMIAAESLGVASAMIEGFDPSQIKEEFGVPDDHTICGLIALGYALDLNPAPGRFGLDHVCYQEHFGQPWTLGEAEG